MRKYILSAGAALAALFAPTAAMAEDPDIVVTATRLPAPVTRLPADVEVLDVEALRARGVASLADALAEAPGLAVLQSGGFGQQTSLFSAGTNSNQTLVLFDGIRLNDPSTPNAMFDAGEDTLGGLTRIEVVQGPMSALYGSDAIGGVVNLLPRHGRDGALNAQLEAAAGSFGTMSGSAGADGTLGRFRYALTAEGYATDGYDIVPRRFTTHDGETDGAQSTTLTGVFDVDVTETFALDLLLRQRRASADFDAFDYPPPFFNEVRIEDHNLELSRNDLTLARLGARWRLAPGLSLRATGGQIEDDRVQRDDGVQSANYHGERRFADLTGEWRRDGAAVAAGFAWEREQVDLNNGFSAIDAAQEHRSAFASAQGDIGRLTLTAAARGDDFDGFGTHSTWRAGASYALMAQARVYAAYGTSFRAPSLSERFTPFYGNPALKPEAAEGWEIGAEARLLGVELEAVHRALDVDNLIAGAPPSYINANVARAEIDSTELQAAAHPLPWLTARIGYVHTDARDAATQTRLQRRPANVWTAALQASHGSFKADLAWRRVGESFDRLYDDGGAFLNMGDLPGYDVVRVSASWSVNDAVQLYAAADNLLDERYEAAGGYAGPPRALMAGVRMAAGAR